MKTFILSLILSVFSFSLQAQNFDKLADIINGVVEGDAINFAYGENCVAKTDNQKKHQFQLKSVVKSDGCGSAFIGKGTTEQLIGVKMAHHSLNEHGDPCTTLDPSDFKWTHEIKWDDDNPVVKAHKEPKVGKKKESTIPNL